MIIILDIVQCRKFFSKHDVSETGYVSVIMQQGRKIRTKSDTVDRASLVPWVTFIKTHHRVSS
jgi:hypothetical protein